MTDMLESLVAWTVPLAGFAVLVCLVRGQILAALAVGVAAVVVVVLPAGVSAIAHWSPPPNLVLAVVLAVVMIGLIVVVAAAASLGAEDKKDRT